MTREQAQSSRRDVLLLLGIGVAAPAALVLLNGPEPVRATVADVAVRVTATGRQAMAVAGVQHGHGEGWSWPDVVRVWLEVRNEGGSAVLLSPGQFRLRVATGLSVMPSAWLHPASALRPGEVRRTWVDYRAPGEGGGDAVLEFTPAGHREPTPLSLVAGSTSGAQS